MSWQPTARCSCGATFNRPDSRRWQRQCFPCWQKSRPVPVEESDQDRRLRYAEEECQQLRRQLADERRASSAREQAASEELDGYGRALKAVHAAVEAEGMLTPAMVQDMILLCHPDRHQNNERSTRVTAWLLERR